MPGTISGEFADRGAAERAVTALHEAGFDRRRIRMSPREQVEGAPPAPVRAKRSMRGSIIGSLIGGSVGALIAALSSLLVPAAQHMMTAGVVTCAIVGGTIGWFLGGLAASGSPIEEGEYRQERLELGAMLVTVDPQERATLARQVLQQSGARVVREGASLPTNMSEMDQSAPGKLEDQQRALN